VTIKKRLSLKPGKRSKLAPEVRQVLSSGIDYFGDLDRLEPIPRDRYGRIERSMRGDDPTPGRDGRIDFLCAEWALHKDEVMKWHVDKWRDGSRPWAWWAFGDAPEPRHDCAPSASNAGRHTTT
jgi:hypothetical protein